MFNKKPPSLVGADALVFYGQRLKLIRDDLYYIGCLWRSCEKPKSIESTGHGDEYLVSCNKQGVENPCKSCIENIAIAKEKRRLKAQFNSTVSKMLEFVPSNPVKCYKELPSFVDIEFKKLEESE